MYSSKVTIGILFLTLIYFSGANPASAIDVNVTAVVQGCGDGIVSGGEECDGSNMNGATCASKGYGGGALSCTASCIYNTTTCSPVVVSGGGGGGSGGGGGLFFPPVPDTNVAIAGRAYPNSKVYILKDGQVALSTIAGPDSLFSATISGLSTGNYTFAVYGEDAAGVRSNLFTFPISITSGATTKISGIFIPPTISVDKTQVKKGDVVTIFGKTSPSAEVTITVNSEEEFFIKNTADSSGAYLVRFDTTPLEIGQHTTQARSTIGDTITPASQLLGFSVGSQNVAAGKPQKSFLKGDLNNDRKVNLLDFSIAAYWYKKKLSGTFTVVESERLNGDGAITIADFSIMAFNWTG